jgi:hypothetical protein
VAKAVPMRVPAPIAQKVKEIALEHQINEAAALTLLFEQASTRTPSRPKPDQREQKRSLIG